jgi:hypothetical protein
MLWKGGCLCSGIGGRLLRRHDIANVSLFGRKLASSESVSKAVESSGAGVTRPSDWPQEH